MDLCRVLTEPGGGVVSDALDHELVYVERRNSWEPACCLKEGGSGGCDGVALCGRGAASADKTSKWEKWWGKHISITPWLWKRKTTCTLVLFSSGSIDCLFPHCVIVAIRNWVNCYLIQRQIKTKHIIFLSVHTCVENESAWLLQDPSGCRGALWPIKDRT